MRSSANRKSGAEGAAALDLWAFGDDSVANDDLSLLRACFGVGCPNHHRCARYAAVVDSQANPATMGTCLRRDAYPLFVEVCAARSPLPT
jgi:hypothetical protein